MTEVLVAGLAPQYLPYIDGWELQRRTHRRVVDGSGPDTLILCEHSDVFTAGRRTSASERPSDGTPVVDVDRGGKITWHGPGQLTGYPIVRLPEPVDVIEHVRRLEQVMIDVVGRFGVDGRRIDGRSGVWVSGPGGDNKIGAVGVRVADGVAMHGFALNCSNSLDPFSRIVPCGITDAGVTTLSLETGREITPADVLDSLVSIFLAGAIPVETEDAA
ncbi:MAG TPA: lipoyl(octanoyl) transferase LipB [Mycetocola sp.]|jgi:lipoyl(octanoyl) transferase|uniref:lipoyl(octanoyl) transferase LipB n=1 Tax=Mycetocola sp. TaxID=1871042 RepID=UPI0026158738|nr:lipoyl(octanoyl) transferase LipB [Mycetocola sp.]MCU1418922.1 lipB [Mycetocola sp.]MCU1561335.1 lipB [Mycetocola sp.]HEV7848098.1 lipoyl(octanoyl) transferase LipB [Mycetocola sp.]